MEARDHPYAVAVAPLHGGADSLEAQTMRAPDTPALPAIAISP